MNHLLGFFGAVLILTGYYKKRDGMMGVASLLLGCYSLTLHAYFNSFVNFTFAIIAFQRWRKQ